MKSFLLATALAGFAFATSANAHLVDLTYIPYGGPTGADVPLGYTQVSFSHLSGTFSLVTGSLHGKYAAPDTTNGPVTTQYLAERGGDSGMLALPGGQTSVAVYIGSLDAFNTISFTSAAGTLSYTGTELASMTGAQASGNQTSPLSNGLFVFNFSKDEEPTSVGLKSSKDSFEIAAVSVGNAIPEPSTWVMMAAGLAGLGFAAFRKPRKPNAIV